MFKLQRIEKLIGYQVFRAPLPDFIASGYGDTSGHRPSRPSHGKRRFGRK
jgi:hypothetical protein